MGILLHVALELYQHVCVYLGVLGDWMDMVFAKVKIMESILNINFCGINESLASENAG